MKTRRLLDKLWMGGKEFVTSDIIQDYCRRLDLDYNTSVKNFVYRGHLTRIFKGIFYVRPPNGSALGDKRYNHLDLVAKGLEMKGVKRWYLGLYSALKLNGMTHEYFTIDIVINDSIFRQKPIKIAGCRFKFTKLVARMFDFGIVKEDLLRYSDPEKTILDFVYLWKQNGKDDTIIEMNVSEWAENISKERMRMYVQYYPNSVAKTIDGLIR